MGNSPTWPRSLTGLFSTATESMPAHILTALNSVEKPGRLLAQDHPTDEIPRHKRCELCIKLVAFGKRSALVESVERNADSGMDGSE
jgi:hypothetical protein